MFRNNVALLRQSAPEAAILVVGPPDGNRIGKSCSRAERRNAACETAAAADACLWHEPPYLAAIRQIQKKVAVREG